MSELLVIEDDENKLSEIEKFLKDEFPGVEYRLARSYNAGVLEILQNDFKYCILDMSLPTFNANTGEGGGKRRPFGGREIIRKAFKKKMRIKFVVLTQFESFGEGKDLISKEVLNMDLKMKFEKLFTELIYFSTSSTAWKKDLRQNLLEYFIC